MSPYRIIPSNEEPNYTDNLVVIIVKKVASFLGNNPCFPFQQSRCRSGAVLGIILLSPKPIGFSFYSSIELIQLTRTVLRRSELMVRELLKNLGKKFLTLPNKHQYLPA
jgi:hypothetical protein